MEADAPAKQASARSARREVKAGAGADSATARGFAARRLAQKPHPKNTKLYTQISY
jgi:hypothetical protein